MNQGSLVPKIIFLATLLSPSAAFAQTAELTEVTSNLSWLNLESQEVDSASNSLKGIDLQEIDKSPLEPQPPEIIASETLNPNNYQTANSLYREVETQAQFLEPADPTIAAMPEQPASSTAPTLEVAQTTPVRPIREGLYGSVSADWRFLQSIDITGVRVPNAGAINPIGAEFNSGFGINGAVGYKLPNQIRVEGQIAYGRNAIGDVNLPGVPAVLGAPVTAPLVTAPNAVIPAGTNIGAFVVPVNLNVGGIPLNPGNPPTLAQAVPIPAPGTGTIPAGTPLPAGIPTAGGTTTTPVVQPAIPAVAVNASGSISTLSGLLNVYYDFETQSNWEPYLGAGVGLSRLSANNLSVTYPGTTLSASVDDSTWGLVYQLMAGVAYYFNPRTAVTAGYRYFDPIGNNSFNTPLGEVKIEGLGVHNLEVGLRYFF